MCAHALGYFNYYDGFAHDPANGTELDTTLPNGVVQPTPLPDGPSYTNAGSGSCNG